MYELLVVSTLMTISDPKIAVFGNFFLQFSAAAHTSRVKCNEMDGDKPR